jgi:hypothetical protein
LGARLTEVGENLVVELDDLLTDEYRSRVARRLTINGDCVGP